jgi:electron transfer flavoprotein alpha subunit
MKTLVWVEHEQGQLKDATLPTVTAAAKLGEVHLLVAGSGVSDVAAAAAKIAGVGKVMSPTTRPMAMASPRMSRRSPPA